MCSRRECGVVRDSNRAAASEKPKQPQEKFTDEVPQNLSDFLCCSKRPAFAPRRPGRSSGRRELDRRSCHLFASARYSCCSLCRAGCYAALTRLLPCQSCPPALPRNPAQLVSAPGSVAASAMGEALALPQPREERLRSAAQA